MANVLRLHPEVRRRMQAFLTALRRGGYVATLTSAYRSPAEQERLFELHRSNPAEFPLPVARPGCSTHQYGLAFDVMTDLPLGNRGDFGSFYGLYWGGSGDPVHFDVFGWQRWRQILHAAAVC